MNFVIYLQAEVSLDTRLGSQLVILTVKQMLSTDHDLVNDVFLRFNYEQLLNVYIIIIMVC